MRNTSKKEDYEAVVEEKLEDVAASAQEAASSIKENFQEIGELTKKAAIDAFNQVQKDAKKYIDKGQAKLQSAEEKMEKKMKQYPMQTLLISAGVGFVLGLMSRK